MNSAVNVDAQRDGTDDGGDFFGRNHSLSDQAKFIRIRDPHG